jgi:hypothetical protein
MNPATPKRTFRFMDTDNRLIYQQFKPGDCFVLLEFLPVMDGSQEVVLRKLSQSESNGLEWTSRLNRIHKKQALYTMFGV